MIPDLYQMSEEEYNKILKSGMFWEWYPDATGNWLIDTGRAVEDD